MTAKPRRITASKPARRRDVSGFGRRVPTAQPPPDERGLEQNQEQVEMIIELHPPSEADDFSSWLSDEQSVVGREQVVDVRLILPPGDEPS